MDGDGGTDTKTAIEVHFTPSYMFFPIHNSRMQKWFYRHVFTEGIGLRQLIDYYFVLVKSEERRVKNLTALQRELKYLGLWKFAGAVMYVLHEALGLPEAKMIAPIDVNEGRFLLAEIMQGGNFGQYDTRLGSKENEGKLHRYLRMSLRNLRFVKHYPTAALSEPLFRTMELSSLFLYKSIKIDKMEVIKTDIDGVLIIEPRLFRDARGYFFESFSEREFKEKV